jgi:hypothetical protein
MGLGAHGPGGKGAPSARMHALAWGLIDLIDQIIWRRLQLGV